MHPACPTPFCYKIILNDTFSPVPGSGVGEVYHTKLDGNAVNQVCLVSRVLDEVAHRVSFRKLVLSNTFSASQIGNVGVDVDKGLHSVFLPVIHHSFPLRVVLSIQLPIPE